MEFAPIAALEAASIPHKFPVVYIYLRERDVQEAKGKAMTNLRPIVVLAAVLALASAGMAVAAQEPTRASDQQLKNLLSRIFKGTDSFRTSKEADQFRKSLDEALDRSAIDGSKANDNINQFVTEFEETTEHLSDHFGRNQVVANDIEDVLRRGVSIDGFHAAPSSA